MTDIFDAVNMFPLANPGCIDLSMLSNESNGKQVGFRRRTRWRVMADMFHAVNICLAMMFIPEHFVKRDQKTKISWKRMADIFDAVNMFRLVK
jgi:hypothetical protein